MNIGDQFLLISEAPYSPFGHNTKAPLFVTVTVMEERHDASGEFTGKKGTGYIAKGSDGYNYAFNYPNISEGFGNGVWQRYLPDEEFLALSEDEQNAYATPFTWRDITLFQAPGEATVVKSLDFIDYCDIHQHHFYINGYCFGCRFKAPPQGDRENQVRMNMTEHRWTGWYDEEARIETQA